MRRNIFTYIILVIAVAIGGEFQIYQGIADFRISLGTPVFLFFLLWAKRLRPIPAGIIVGIFVYFFRTITSVIAVNDISFAIAFSKHFPVIFYYVVYGLLFHLFKVRNYYDRPLLIALIGIIIENIASWVEIFSRSLFIYTEVTLSTFLTIFIISIFRSFFVLGIVSYSLLKDATLKKELQRQRNEDMLLLVADLFVEMVQLKKTMNNAEKATRDCYKLYKDLMNKGLNPLAKRTLKIAGEVHEIKKDSQRIKAGLLKLRISEQMTNLMSINKIIEIAIKSNKHYARELNKNINFKVNISGDHPYYNNLIVMSIINNLITNAIESIEEEGTIIVNVNRQDDNLELMIIDNGPGIYEDKQLLVFEPGYTTKYDEEGLPSSGIGLSHIKEVIENMDGKILLKSSTEKRETRFLIQLPIKNINTSR